MTDEPKKRGRPAGVRVMIVHPVHIEAGMDETQPGSAVRVSQEMAKHLVDHGLAMTIPEDDG